MPSFDHLRISRRPSAAHPPVALSPGLELPRGRAHEVCGPSRVAFAALAAGRVRGPVLWLRMSRAEGRLDPEGLAEFFDPSRLVLGLCRKSEDALWCAEEALRSRTVQLVIVEIEAPPALTPVRRLHLAAEAGGGSLALLLTSEGGAQGVETRWRLSPAPAGSWDEPSWTLERLRARLAPPARWRARWQAEGRRDGRLDLAPEGAPADQVLA